MEADHRNRTYHRHLRELVTDDFIEACDRILYSDEWFPTIARIRAVAGECAAERNRNRRAVTITPPLVCPYCHGSRWVRLGGYDADPKMQAGDEGSRVQPCPRCTSEGRHDPYKERQLIADEGGVPNEAAPKDIDLSRTTWRVPRTPEGRVDMNELYRQSRILRELDPNVDARPKGVGSWKSPGDVMTLAPEPEPELVAVGDWSVDDDSIPF